MAEFTMVGVELDGKLASSLEAPGVDVPSSLYESRSGRDRASEIVGDERAAENARLTGTPSLLIGASGGAMSGFSPSDPTSFDAAIEGLLKGAA
jgi:hypothetical protein